MTDLRKPGPSEIPEFAQRVITGLVDEGVKVYRQRAYTGRVSGRDIKVDVSFNSTAAGSDVLVLVECKCYSRRVPVDDVEEFHSKIDDIGAHKGIMITTVGYQEGAIKVAKGRRIALVLLTKERQGGDLFWVIKSRDRRLMSQHDGFWQGNVRGFRDNFDDAIRFEDLEQFLRMLVQDAWTQTE